MPPPNEPQRPDQGKFYKQISEADPLASPNQPSKFDFMLKNQPKPKKSFGLPSNMGKASKIFALALIILVVVIIAAMVLGSGSSSSAKVIDLMARNQELIRVSKLEEQHFQDSNIKGLAATTEAIMTSQQSDFNVYLQKIKVKKVDPKQLATHINKNTDAQLQTAAQNNNLDGAYALYLKTALASYQSSLNQVYRSTKSKTLKTTLKSAYSSVATLLKSPQFTSS